MTQQQKRSIRLHTIALRWRIEQGWTPRLQQVTQERLRDLETCKVEENLEKITAQLDDLYAKGCYSEGSAQAYYSIGCCWWTDLPGDLGSSPPTTSRPDGKGGFIIGPAKEGEEGSHSLPCCPGCGSMLMQGDLAKFINGALAKPEHYGDLENFWRARGRVPCEKDWKRYAA